MHTLAAGLLDNNAEFFTSADMHAFCLKGGRVNTLDQIDSETLAIIEADMANHPEKLKGIARMGISERTAVINQYIVCNFGGFDNTPDIIDGQLQAKEYWPCPNRGACAGEGIVCERLKSDSGQLITPAEIKVIKRTALGDLDKEIADKLDIAPSTVATHTRNIRRKTGLFRKVDFALFAAQKNLL